MPNQSERKVVELTAVHAGAVVGLSAEAVAMPQYIDLGEEGVGSLQMEDGTNLADVILDPDEQLRRYGRVVARLVPASEARL
ncbi:hypothetical protein [Frondihabitans cladoniiphilus]|uniref:Uncharacterized protein n=1 Tax=Frondihabitans cladoniiphilus TaxID=715785 RepID=A0ABP8W3Q1_9MICO